MHFAIENVTLLHWGIWSLSLDNLLALYMLIVLHCFRLPQSQSFCIYSGVIITARIIHEAQADRVDY
jgi:hypothetical protein